MVTVFYIIVAMCLMFEALCLLKSKTIYESVKKHKGVKDYTKMSSNFATFVVFNWLYMLICFVGLLSSQWLGFLAILLLAPIPKKCFTWRLIDGVLSVMILVFIILNKYHFHIEFTDLLIKFFAQ